MKDYMITSEQIDKMHHCIGFEKAEKFGIKNRKLKCYRNYYSSAGDLALDNLVEQGLMSKSFSQLSNAYLYRVSIEGLQFLGKISGQEITIKN